MTDESGRFKELLVGFILFGLFGFLVLTAVSHLANEYDKNTEGVLDGAYDLDSYSSYTSTVGDFGEERGEEFQQDEPFSSGEIVVSGIFAVALGFVALIMTPFNLLNGVVYLIIGNYTVATAVTGVLAGLLAITIILGIWRVIKTGD